MKNNSEKYFDEFKERFSYYTDKEIISAFNNEVGNTGWGTARASFLTAIHYEFDRRNFEYSEIGDSKSLSFKYSIRMNDKKILINLSKSE